MSTLALKNVSYTYEGSKKTVLKNITINFNSGKVYVIVGKSGAGKSTLLSLMSGLDLPTTGSVMFSGENLAEVNRNHFRSRKAGIIFQGLNLLTNATAIENIVLSMNISGVSEQDKKAKALALLEKVGISKEKAYRKILKLSGGEAQRIAIARALAHNPDLIIADEPTGNLDKSTEERVLKIFSGLAHKAPEKGGGKCVIIVTHSKRVATIADEIWGVEKGVLVQIPVRKRSKN